MSGNQVYAVQASRTARDVLWVGTNEGFDQLDTRTGRVTRYLEEVHPTIRAIHEDEDGILWLGRGGGLIDPGTQSTEWYTDASLEWVVKIFADPDTSGVLWLGTSFGLHRFDSRTETLEVSPCHVERSPGPSGRSRDIS